MLTVSSSRYILASQGQPVTDESGDLAAERLQAAGHRVVSKRIIDDSADMIRAEVLRAVYEQDVDAVLLAGGTGLAKRDLTIEAVRPLLDKELAGFGELFRMVSYQKIGSPAVLTRALAGTITGHLVFCLPGSPDAVATALDLILLELPHAVSIARG